MTIAPAGWYPDPENPTTKRYWNGAAWAAPVPAKKARASKVLARFAIAAGAVAPVAMISAVGLGLATLAIATAFGMPHMDPDVLIEGLMRWAASGAWFGLPFLVIAIVLAVIATVVKPRAVTRTITTTWVVIGVSAFLVAITLAVARPFDF